MATYQEFSRFLAGVEKRAFKHAIFAVKDRDAALDIVQEAMLKLTENYSGKPPEELPMLFQRILQNAINDHFRKNKVRSLWMVQASTLVSDDETDPLETLDTREMNHFATPPELLDRAQVVANIEAALESLPPRQREAFLLRYWEEMDTTETAEIMGCSEGSVKTHCSRAAHAIAAFLKAKGITP